ncbi:MAG: HEAT repeat domain-containing protein, partial [Candidatus Woesearchaeota archaeon]
ADVERNVEQIVAEYLSDEASGVIVDAKDPLITTGVTIDEETGNIIIIVDKTAPQNEGLAKGTPLEDLQNVIEKGVETALKGQGVNVVNAKEAEGSLDSAHRIKTIEELTYGSTKPDYLGRTVTAYTEIQPNNVDNVFSYHVGSFDDKTNVVKGAKAMVFMKNDGSYLVVFSGDNDLPDHLDLERIAAENEGDAVSGRVSETFGYQLQLDPNTGMIIGIQMDSTLTTQQRTLQVAINKNVIDAANKALMESIDPSLLESEFVQNYLSHGIQREAVKLNIVDDEELSSYITDINDIEVSQKTTDFIKENKFDRYDISYEIPGTDLKIIVRFNIKHLDAGNTYWIVLDGKVYSYNADSDEIALEKAKRYVQIYSSLKQLGVEKSLQIAYQYFDSKFEQLKEKDTFTAIREAQVVYNEFLQRFKGLSKREQEIYSIMLLYGNNDEAKAIVSAPKHPFKRNIVELLMKTYFLNDYWPIRETFAELGYPELTYQLYLDLIEGKITKADIWRAAYKKYNGYSEEKVNIRNYIRKTISYLPISKDLSDYEQMTDKQKDSAIDLFRKLNQVLEDSAAEYAKTKQGKEDESAVGFLDVRKLVKGTSIEARYQKIMDRLVRLARETGDETFIQGVRALRDLNVNDYTMLEVVNNYLFDFFKANELYFKIGLKSRENDRIVEIGKFLKQPEPATLNLFLADILENGLIEVTYKGISYTIYLVHDPDAKWGGYSEYSQFVDEKQDGKNIVVYINDPDNFNADKVISILIHEIKHKEDSIDSIALAIHDLEARAYLAEVMYSLEPLMKLQSYLNEYGMVNVDSEPHQYGYNYAILTFLRAFRDYPKFVDELRSEFNIEDIKLDPETATIDEIVEVLRPGVIQEFARMILISLQGDISRGQLSNLDVALKMKQAYASFDTRTNDLSAAKGLNLGKELKDRGYRLSHIEYIKLDRDNEQINVGSDIDKELETESPDFEERHRRIYSIVEEVKNPSLLSNLKKLMGKDNPNAVSAVTAMINTLQLEGAKERLGKDNYNYYMSLLFELSQSEDHPAKDIIVEKIGTAVLNRMKIEQQIDVIEIALNRIKYSYDDLEKTDYMGMIELGLRTSRRNRVVHIKITPIDDLLAMPELTDQQRAKLLDIKEELAKEKAEIKAREEFVEFSFGRPYSYTSIGEKETNPNVVQPAQQRLSDELGNENTIPPITEDIASEPKLDELSPEEIEQMVRRGIVTTTGIDGKINLFVHIEIDLTADQRKAIEKAVNEYIDDYESLIHRIIEVIIGDDFKCEQGSCIAKIVIPNNVHGTDAKIETNLEEAVADVLVNDVYDFKADAITQLDPKNANEFFLRNNFAGAMISENKKLTEAELQVLIALQTGAERLDYLLSLNKGYTSTNIAVLLMGGMSDISEMNDDDEAQRISKLITQLGDKNPNVRSSAVNALDQLADTIPDKSKLESAIPALITALGDKYSGVKEYAKDVLVKIGMPAIPALITLLRDESSFVKIDIADALVKIGEPAIPALITALRDKNSGVRKYAVYALVKLIDMIPDKTRLEPVIPALVTALRDKDNYVK